jgi:hypothetical protein
MIGSLNDNFGVIGFAIVGVFVVSWAVASYPPGHPAALRLPLPGCCREVERT